MFIAMFSFSQTFAKSLQVDGVTVTTDNADDVLGDGNVAYDAKTNTLSFKTINIMGSKSSLICTSDKSSDISVDEKTTSLTLSCKGTITYEGTATGVVGIQYGGRLILAGSGVLKMTTDSSAIICETLSVEGGSVVELCRDKTGYGYTLEADYIFVDNSVLYVHEGAHDSGVNSTTQLFESLDGCYSNAKLLHESVDCYVRERYYYTYDGNVRTYRYRTVLKSKRYDGWYDSNFNQVSELEVYTESYSVWVDGVQVTRYNYLDILGDGLYAYDPVTKTLTTKTDAGDVQFEGYLKTVDAYLQEKESYSTESTGLISESFVAPEYESQYQDSKDEVRIVFWTYSKEDGFKSWHLTDDGEFSFPGLASGSITYDKSTFTLTLEDVKTSCEVGMYVKDHSLNIRLVGSNILDGMVEPSIQASYVHKLNIFGDGSLECAYLHSVCDSTIIQGGCKINTNFAAGTGILTIDNSTLELNGDTLFGNYSGIENFDKLNLVDVVSSDESIAYRVEYFVDKYDGNLYSMGELVDSDGFKYKGMLTYSPRKNSYVSSFESDKEFDFNAPKYDLFGRPVRDNYKGVYIQSGRKFKSLEE